MGKLIRTLGIRSLVSKTGPLTSLLVPFCLTSLAPPQPDPDLGDFYLAQV
jgi:hypothetical protein